ncbi:lipopolysaccharide biosynthesis protein [Xylanimonas protaetiae]|uniref:Lipopolysaccharide biosynthesis protein n=1 Tax=Xylanimonas protaetiae TaxID=2509457 RepID=A0A4P6F2P3_9MICO|nr:lipopolysaccharide biosynthesis protein [Xylanimonas protaetiae]QAY69506.1 lipopolysaccharide biosynthesis protein [Xylanimonas protaetiae]
MSAPAPGTSAPGTSAPGTSAPRGGLAHTASRGVALTMGGLWTRSLLQLGSTVVLARLLVPADFGLVAMVMAIVGVADLLRDFGMTGAIIQARDLDQRTWQGVLWFSAGLGLALSALVAAAAPLVASLYGEPRLVVLTLAIAPTLLLNGLAMPLQAGAQRSLRFGLLARIDVTSTAAGVLGAVAAALAGWGVWSLVVLAGLGQVTRLVELWVAVRPRFGRPHVDRDVLPLVGTGGSILGVQVLNYAARNLDNVIVGHQLGSAVLGQYSRAYSLFLLPLQQLTGPLGRVALPVLSALRDDADRFRRYVRSAMLVIGYAALPGYALLAGTARPLVAVALGPQWHLAATIFALLAIAGVAQAVGNVQGWLYIALGRAHRQLGYYAVTRPLVVAGFFAGIAWDGVQGLALVYGIVTCALLVPGFAYAIHGTFVTGADVVAPLVRPAVLVLPCFAAAFAVSRLVVAPDAVVLALALAAGVAVLGAALVLPGYRRDVARIVSFARQVRRPRQDRSAPDPTVRTAA